MAPPYKFDESGPKVGLISDEGMGDTFVVHEELLDKSNSRFHGHALYDSFGLPNMRRSKITYGKVDPSANVVGPFIRWLYHGDLDGEYEVKTLESIFYVMQESLDEEHYPHCRDFQDYLVDKAIRLITSMNVKDAVRQLPEDLPRLFNWSSEARQGDDPAGGIGLFVLDWLARVNAGDTEFYEKLQKRAIYDRRLYDCDLSGAIANARLEAKKDEAAGVQPPPWVRDRCRYHLHGKYRHCHRVPKEQKQGGIEEEEENCDGENNDDVPSGGKRKYDEYKDSDGDHGDSKRIRAKSTHIKVEDNDDDYLV